MLIPPQSDLSNGSRAPLSAHSTCASAAGPGNTRANGDSVRVQKTLSL
jgi:hypothetical protein